jgi:REP element-mobilizing transposase RayT
VRSWELFRFGKATKVSTRGSVAQVRHDVGLRLAAKEALRYRPVSFSGVQCREIGEGFKEAMARSGMVLYACSILPEHTHLVVKRHRCRIERVRGQLKAEASKALVRAGMHPFGDVVMKSGSPHSPWADEGWDVYLDSAADIRRAIAYVEGNPEKEGKPRQRWSFVRPYSESGW